MSIVVTAIILAAMAALAVHHQRAKNKWS